MESHFGFRTWLIWGSVKAIDLPNMAGSILNMRNFVSPLLPQFSPATIVWWTSIPALFAWTTIFLKTCLPRPIAILHVPHRLLWPCEEFAVPSHSEREPLANDESGEYDCFKPRATAGWYHVVPSQVHSRILPKIIHAEFLFNGNFWSPLI